MNRTSRKTPFLLPLALAAALSLSGCGDSNTAPQAIADSYHMYSSDEALTIAAGGVLANDSDADNDTLHAVLVTAPLYHAGEFSLNRDGSFTYIFNGSAGIIADQFEYRVNDGDKDSAAAIVAITIERNEKPTALPDAYRMPSGSLLMNVGANDGVMVNDSDDDGDSLTLSLVSGPQHAASFSLNADGSFSYTAEADGALEDNFVYQVSDGKTPSSPTTVSLALNHAPVASAGCEVLEPATTVYGSLQGLVSDDAIGSVVYSLTSAPQHGDLTLAADGSFSYSTSRHARGFADSFSYTVTDLHGTTASARMKLIYGKPRIMPLGDSLTRGTTGVAATELADGSMRFASDAPEDTLAIGYRKALQEHLTAAGYPFDFVGSQRFGSAAGIADADNEGHLGWTAWQLLNGDGSSTVTEAPIVSFLDANPADVMLLLAGTNDQNVSAASIEGLLQQAASWAVKADNNPLQMVVANIIPQNPEETGYEKYDRVDAWNDSLATILAKSQWADVVGVDLFSAIDAESDMTPIESDYTGLHPNPTGYSKMARAWFDAIDRAGILNRCSDASD